MQRVERPHSAPSQVPSDAPDASCTVTLGPEVTVGPAVTAGPAVTVGPPVTLGRPGWLQILDSGLDAVRIVTACLAAYQATRHAGVPAVSSAPWLDALSLWHLIAIYAASVVFSLALGGHSIVGSARSWARLTMALSAAQESSVDDVTDAGRVAREP